MNNERSRTREGLRIVVNIPSYWSVNNDGFMGEDNFGEGEAGSSFDSYNCDSCGAFFTKVEDNHDAWRAALDHLVVKVEA